MKKWLALFLVVIMAFSLVACSGGSTNDTTTPDNSGSAGSSDTGTAGSSDAGSAGSSNTGSGGSSDAGSGASMEGAAVIGSTGAVDHFARDPYTISYVYGNSAPINIGFTQALEDFGKRMNFNVKSTGADFDPARVLEIIQADIDLGVDGFLINVMSETYQREHEMLREAGIPYINVMGPYFDAQGNNMAPAVAFNGYQAGSDITDWWLANYSTYLGEADLSSIGFMVVTFTVALEFTERSDGALDRFRELHPELENNIYYVDLTNFSMDIAYDSVAATVSGNAEIEKWVIFAVAEDFAVGANRAVESLNRVGSIIVLTTGNDVAFEEWGNNATPQLVALVPVWKTSMMGAAAEGIIALVDGRETEDTLWKEIRRPNDVATLFYVETEVVTRDTYRDFIARIDAEFGIT